MIADRSKQDFFYDAIRAEEPRAVEMLQALLCETVLGLSGVNLIRLDEWMQQLCAEEKAKLQ